MLLGYRANYPSRLYVFADYNAGRYASRNTAFQHMVATLSKRDLALDGDLMLYEGGKPRPEASSLPNPSLIFIAVIKPEAMITRYEASTANKPVKPSSSPTDE